MKRLIAASLLGAPLGALAGCGKARRFVSALAIVVSASGVVALCVGSIALASGQPYAVYGPFLTAGGVMTVVSAFLFPVVWSD